MKQARPFNDDSLISQFSCFALNLSAFKNVTTENRNLNQWSVETVKNTTLCKLHYADDTQLYLAFKPGCASSTDDAIAAMERCVNEIRAWMLCDKLKINDGKSEFVIIGTCQQLSKVHVYSLAVGDAQVSGHG